MNKSEANLKAIISDLAKNDIPEIKYVVLKSEVKNNRRKAMI